MSEEQPEYTRKELTDQIPEFDGGENGISLNFFLEAVEFARSNAKTLEIPYIERIALCKLKGKASRLIHSRRLTDWAEIAILLTHNFEIDKSSEQLMRELFEIQLRENSPKTVYNKIAPLRDQIMLKLTVLAKTKDAKIVISDIVEGMAKASFRKNLNHDIEVAICSQKFKTLEEIYNSAKEIERQFKFKNPEIKRDKPKHNFHSNKYKNSQPKPSSSENTNQKTTNSTQDVCKFCKKTGHNYDNCYTRINKDKVKHKTKAVDTKDDPDSDTDVSSTSDDESLNCSENTGKEAAVFD